MAKVVKTVFTCDICGESYFTEDEYKDCYSRCKRIEKENQEREEWFTSRPPKFIVGDIVKIDEKAAWNYMNAYFQVEDVEKSTYKLQWEYYGRTGGQDVYGDDEDYIPNYNKKTWVPEEYLRLTIPQHDFSADVRDSIVRILNAFTQKEREE